MSRLFPFSAMLISSTGVVTFLLVMVEHCLISKFAFQLFNLVLKAHEDEKHLYEFICA